MDNISMQYNICTCIPPGLGVIRISSHIKTLNLDHPLGGLVASLSRCGER
jgi:hypothetical protein